MPGPAFIGFADSTYAAIALFCIGGFAHQALNGGDHDVSDLFPPQVWQARLDRPVNYWSLCYFALC